MKKIKVQELRTKKSQKSKVKSGKHKKDKSHKNQEPGTKKAKNKRKHGLQDPREAKRNKILINLEAWSPL